MRRLCERKRRIRRLIAVACGAAALALLFYCVPWWVFMLIGVIALLLAGWKLLSFPGAEPV